MKRLPVEQLEAGMVLAQDVYVTAESDSAVLRKGAVLNERAMERLQRWAVRHVFIQDAAGNEPSLAAQMRQQAKSNVQKAPPLIAAEVRDEAVHTLETVFGSVTKDGRNIRPTPETVAGLHATVDKVVGALKGAPGVLMHIGDLKSYDDYTYHHSLAVAVLSVGIGQHAGMSDDSLRHLGLCALMHDIGKTAIPVEVIRKPAKLDEFEYNLIKTHSTAGKRYLTGTSIGDEALWEGVLHHHEKMDGTGYPNALHGEAIPLESRIISVADVYDALTSNRPYREPLQPADALEYVMGATNTFFDYDIVNSLVKKVDLYPVGSVVELSNGAFALVLDTENPARPVVEMLGSGAVVDLGRDRGMLNVVVVRLVPDEELVV